MYLSYNKYLTTNWSCISINITGMCGLSSEGIYPLLSDNFLLVADENQIVQIDIETLNDYRLSINVTSEPQVLAYDWLRQDVYWTSATNASVIFKYSFVDENTSVAYYDQTSTQQQL